MGDRILSSTSIVHEQMDLSHADGSTVIADQVLTEAVVVTDTLRHAVVDRNSYFKSIGI